MNDTVLIYGRQPRTLRPSRSSNTMGIVAVVLALAALGLLNLYSASMGGEHFFTQLKHVSIGFVALVISGWVIQARHLNTYAYYFYALTTLLLLAVDIIGHTAGGAQRWLVFGPIRIQPSELAKLTTAITVSRFFYTNRCAHPYRLRDMWIILLMVGIIFGLIFAQPDLGTGGFCLLVAVVQILFLRIDLKSAALVASASVVSAFAAWFLFLYDYQKLRILTLLNPSFDPYGTGYHAQQSLIAVGSGGLWGKGLLQGTQTQLQFLPARHTDFVFSVFAEEHGFWLCLLLFGLFSVFQYIALDIARQSKNSFNALLAVGVSMVVYLEFIINVAMVLGIFPVVGVPLPFFSYGGSSILTVCIAAGLLISIDRENHGLSRSPRIYQQLES
jgi:rod shape determining protein RodA